MEYRRMMNKDLKSLESNFCNVLKEIHDSLPKTPKKDNVKCLPLKTLNIWYKENAEIPEIDDYFRVKNTSWDKLTHRQKQQMYDIQNG